MTSTARLNEDLFTRARAILRSQSRDMQAGRLFEGSVFAAVGAAITGGNPIGAVVVGAVGYTLHWINEQLVPEDYAKRVDADFARDYEAVFKRPASKPKYACATPSGAGN